MEMVAAAPSTLYWLALPPRKVHAPPVSAVPHPPLTTRLNVSARTIVDAAEAAGEPMTVSPATPRATVVAAATTLTAGRRRLVAVTGDGAAGAFIIMAASSVAPTARL